MDVAGLIDRFQPLFQGNLWAGGMRTGGWRWLRIATFHPATHKTQSAYSHQTCALSLFTRNIWFFSNGQTTDTDFVIKPPYLATGQNQTTMIWIQAGISVLSIYQGV